MACTVFVLQPLELSIIRVGAIPVKSSKGEPVTWLSPGEMKLKDLVGLNKDKSAGNPSPRVLVPVTLRLQQGKGLGCIICKGPPDFPGIFVQKVKAQGLALEAGLEPGDQIVECNGLQFTHKLTFQEAVVQMKSSPKLELIIQKGVGKALIYERLSNEALSDTASSDKPAVTTAHPAITSSNSNRVQAVAQAITATSTASTGTASPRTGVQKLSLEEEI